MKINRSTRRMFLQGSGGALVSIPFLTSLLPQEAWAQTNQAATVKRLITVRSNFEIGHHSCWLPNDGSNIYNLPQPNRVMAGVNGHHSVRWQPLREFAPTNSSVLASYYGSSASPYLESMNILRGLDFSSRYGHGGCQILGGIGTAANDDPNYGSLKQIQTIDHVINSSKAFNPANSPVINIGELYANASQIFSNGSLRNAPQTGYGFIDIYNSLFLNGSFPETGVALVTNPKANVLNRVLDDYNRLVNSKNISSLDKITLGNAFDKLNDVQKSLTAISGANCSHKNFFSTKTTVSRYEYVHDQNSVVIMKTLADLMTAAIMCDTNRIFNVNLGVYAGLHDNLGFDHEATSHSVFDIVNGKIGWQRMSDRQKVFFINFTMPLVQNLSSAIDPSNGKSYLFNSLVYSTTESGQVHGWGSHPAVLFGNAGGNINSGNYIDYSDRAKARFDGADRFITTIGDPRFSNNYRGVSYNRLLVTILQSMGLIASDYENDSLNSQVYNRTNIGPLNQNLTSIGGFGYAHRWDTTVVNGIQNMQDLQHYDLKQFKHKLPIL